MPATVPELYACGRCAATQFTLSRRSEAIQNSYREPDASQSQTAGGDRAVAGNTKPPF